MLVAMSSSPPKKILGQPWMSSRHAMSKLLVMACRPLNSTVSTCLILLYGTGKQKTYSTEGPAWATVPLVFDRCDITLVPPVDAVWGLKICWGEESGSFLCRGVHKFGSFVSIEHIFYFLWSLWSEHWKRLVNPKLLWILNQRFAILHHWKIIQGRKLQLESPMRLKPSVFGDQIFEFSCQYIFSYSCVVFMVLL